MAKFMFIASYNAEGIKGVLKSGGTSRVDAIKEAAEGLGGRLESFYFGFGGEDAYVVCDLPDNSAAASLAMAAASSGLMGVKTVVLITPGEVDEAAKRSVNYRPPGK
jgi:uncharacterized protein with GYD domain